MKESQEKEHECTFPEFENGNAGPCLECGFKPMDALLELKKRNRLDKNGLAEIIYETMGPFPSGKEFGAYLECEKIALAIIKKYGA